jgi:peptide/nickel transport system permease protein
MLLFVLRRFISAAIMIAALSALAYFLLYFSAGNVARKIVGDLADPEIVARMEEQLGLERPLIVRFGEWAGAALTGDLGRSWFTGQIVTDAIMTRLPVTLSLTVGAILITALVASIIGVVAATRGGWIDRVLQVVSLVISAVPGFLIALLLVLTFAITLGWFPATGYIRPDVSFIGWLSTIALPVTALALGAIAGVAQQVRGSMVDALRDDYVRTLRSRGLPDSRVLYRHVLRNAAGPALSVLGIQFIVIFGGAVIVEQVFSLPGVGQVAVSATARGDIPLVMGIIVVTAVLVAIVNLVVDLGQGVLNPKVRIA